MQRKHIVIAAVVVAGLLAASSYASPYWNLYRLRDAVAAHDAEAVSSHVDFPALRDSIKTQMMGVMAEHAAPKGGENNPFAAMVPAMVAAIANPLIDAMVSPAGVTAMLEHGEMRVAEPAAPQPGDAAAKRKLDWSLRYRNWNHVVVTMNVPDSAGFIFRRDGLWSWKLAALDVPRDTRAGAVPQ